MPKIFISYRREDSPSLSGIIASRLASAFGRSEIVFDVDNFPVGRDFREYIKEKLETCDYLVAVIGKSWLTCCDKTGRPRLEDPADWVRLEIEAALGRERKIPVIPVLLDNVPPLKQEQLPESIRELAYRQAHSVRPPSDFDQDVETLVQKIKSQERTRIESQKRALKKIAGGKTPWSRRPVVFASAAAVAVLVAIVLFHKTNDRGPDAPSGTSKQPSEPPALVKTFPAVTAPVEPTRVGVPALLVAPFDKDEAQTKRAGWATYLGVDEEMTVRSLDLNLVLIPAGRFAMGSPETADQLMKVFPYAKKEWFADERPVHLVTISQPFYLGKYEVTKGQFKKFVEEAKYKTDAEKDGKGGFGYSGDKDKSFVQRPAFTWRDWGVEESDTSPVVNVSYNDAVAFCKWLSKKEGKEYRLPTEAEWEYACRAGTVSRYYNGDDPEDLTKIANVWDAAAKEKLPQFSNYLSSSDGWAFASPVGQFRSNNFGLYDMIGNAREWCSDWYDEDYYSKSPDHDPTGPNSGSYRVSRGGSWYAFAVGCGAASRGGSSPEDRSHNLGFRPARSSGK
jgi:formylglycine-generating enzyme